jgi:lysozyme
VRVANGKIILGPDGKPKDFWKGTDGKVILERTREWLRTVKERTGKTPILYTNQAWWNERMNGVGTIEAALPEYPVWISDLSSKGLKVEDPYLYKGKYRLWQFSFTATADKGGLPPGKKVDADVFQGDIAAFLAAMK